MASRRISLQRLRPRRQMLPSKVVGSLKMIARPTNSTVQLNCAHRVNQCSRGQKWSHLLGPKLFVLSLMILLLASLFQHRRHSEPSLVADRYCSIGSGQREGVPREYMFATAHALWSGARKPLHISVSLVRVCHRLQCTPTQPGQPASQQKQYNNMMSDNKSWPTSSSHCTLYGCAVSWARPWIV